MDDTDTVTYFALSNTDFLTIYLAKCPRRSAEGGRPGLKLYYYNWAPPAPLRPPPPQELLSSRLGAPVSIFVRILRGMGVKLLLWRGCVTGYPAGVAGVPLFMRIRDVLFIINPA